MSGESIKCVKVEEVDLRRLNKKPKQLPAASPEIQQKVRDIEQETQKNFLAQLAKLRERTQAQKAQSGQLKSSLAAVEQKSLANLQQQQEKLQNTLRETANAPTPEVRYQTVLKIQSQQFKPLQEQEKVSLSPDTKETTAKIAQDLLADIQSIALDIEKNYQHERFAPQRLASLKRQIAMAESNHRRGATNLFSPS